MYRYHLQPSITGNPAVLLKLLYEAVGAAYHIDAVGMAYRIVALIGNSHKRTAEGIIVIIAIATHQELRIVVNANVIVFASDETFQFRSFYPREILMHSHQLYLAQSQERISTDGSHGQAIEADVL
jgi:hypothetical protein